MRTTSKAVIDLGFGDSGKGTFTAYLCSQSENPIVVRFSGGHNSGHTVVNEKGLRHVFSSFGSGSMQGIPTYWSKFCTFYPTAFLNELSILNSKGISPKIFVDGKCPITTIADVYHNKKMDRLNSHGSCGVGFGATLEREEKFYSLLVEDLMFPSVFAKKLEMIRYHHYDPHSVSALEWSLFIKDCEDVLENIEIVNNIPSGYDTIIHEGSQGLLLDKNVGFFPHVTRANTGLHNIINGISGYALVAPPEVFYVTRAYQTRHGNGPMTNEKIGHNIKENPDETNTSDGFQGKFRRTLLDVDLLKYAMYKDKSANHSKSLLPTSLVITCLDHIENECRFTSEGRIVNCVSADDFVNQVADFLGMNKVYVSKSDRFDKIQRYR